MSNVAIVEGFLRSGNGKGAARRLRAKDLIPAVVYSKGKGAQSVALEPKSLNKALLGARRRNQLIELKLKDESGAAKGSHFVLTKKSRSTTCAATPPTSTSTRSTSTRPSS